MASPGAQCPSGFYQRRLGGKKRIFTSAKRKEVRGFLRLLARLPGLQSQMMGNVCLCSHIKDNRFGRVFFALRHPRLLSQRGLVFGIPAPRLAGASEKRVCDRVSEPMPVHTQRHRHKQSDRAARLPKAARGVPPPERVLFLILRAVWKPRVWLGSHRRRQRGSVSSLGRRETRSSSTTYGFYIFHSKHLFHQISFTSARAFMQAEWLSRGGKGVMGARGGRSGRVTGRTAGRLEACPRAHLVTAFIKGPPREGASHSSQRKAGPLLTGPS